MQIWVGGYPSFAIVKVRTWKCNVMAVQQLQGASAQKCHNRSWKVGAVCCVDVPVSLLSSFVDALCSQRSAGESNLCFWDRWASCTVTEAHPHLRALLLGNSNLHSVNYQYSRYTNSTFGKPHSLSHHNPKCYRDTISFVLCITQCTEHEAVRCMGACTSKEKWCSPAGNVGGGGKQMHVGDRRWEGDVKSLITEPCINKT